MQVTFTVDAEVLRPLIEIVVRTVLAEKPVTVVAEVEDDPEPNSETESDDSAETAEPVDATSPEEPAASLPEDFNILLHAKAWVEKGKDAAARRKWLKDQLDSIEVKSLTALTEDQLPVFVEAMKNAAV